MSEHAAGPAPVELGERLPDAGSAAEVVHPLGDLGKRSVYLPPPQQPRDPGQAGGEDERLDVLPPGYGVREDEEQARVALHRAADVAEQDQRPPPHPRLPAHEADQLAAGADGVARCAAKIDLATLGRPQPARPALRDSP